MQVTVEFSAQLRVAAGASAEEIELAEGATLGDLVQRLGDVHGEPLRHLLMDDAGQLHPWLIADCNGAMRNGSTESLRDGDRIRLLSPISGG